MFSLYCNEIVTALNGSILPELQENHVWSFRSWGLNVSERKISIQEIYEAHEKPTGSL